MLADRTDAQRCFSRDEMHRTVLLTWIAENVGSLAVAAAKLLKGVREAWPGTSVMVEGRYSAACRNASDLYHARILCNPS